MRFLVASPLPNGWVKLIYQHQVGRNANEPLEMKFRRVAIGVCLDTPSFAVAVGERVYEHNGRSERIYVVLDEFEQSVPARMFPKLIEWKDQYLAQYMYSASSPADQVEALRRTDGLVHYNGLTPGVAQSRWPTFVHIMHTAYPRTLNIPDENEMHRDLELVLSAEATDPHSGMTLYGVDAEPIYRLMFPYDIPTLQTQAGVRGARVTVCKALWLAVMGLERSSGASSLNMHSEDTHTHQPSSITGY